MGADGVTDEGENGTSFCEDGTSFCEDEEAERLCLERLKDLS